MAKLMQKLNTREDFEIAKNRHGGPLACFPDGRNYEFDGLKHRIDIRFHTFNYIDDNAWKVRAGGYCDIFSDDFQIYHFQFPYLETALITAHQKLLELRCLPVEVTGRESVEKQVLNHPVFWHGNPAVVEWFDGVGGTVTLRAQTEDKHFHVPEYVSEVEGTEWDRHRVKVDLLSPHIYWYRQVEE